MKHGLVLALAAVLTLIIGGGSALGMNKAELTEAMSNGAAISKSLAKAVGITPTQADAALGEFLRGSGGALPGSGELKLGSGAHFGLSSLSISLRSTHGAYNPGSGAKIKPGKQLKAKDVAGQAPFVAFAGESSPGFVAFEIVYPAGADRDAPIDVTIPKGSLTFKDGSPVGAVSVTLVNNELVPAPLADSKSTFLRVAMSTDVLFGDGDKLAKAGMAGPLATAAAVVPGTWRSYLTTGDHTELADALAVDADAFAAAVGVTSSTKASVGTSATASKAAPSAADTTSDTKADDTTTGDSPKDADPKDATAPLDRVKETLAKLTVGIAKSAAITREQAAIVVELLTTPDALSVKKGDHVQLIGFGTFSISERAARTGRNPQTGKEIKIARRRVVKFKVGKCFADKVK